MKYGIQLIVIASLILLVASPAQAGKIAVFREAAEQAWRVARRGIVEAAEELTEQGARVARRYGDDGLAALKKVGPRCESLLAEAGAEGSKAASLLARYGDDAVALVKNPARLALASRYGDDAARVFIAHGGVAEPVVATFGKAGASACANLSGQGVRRLAMLADEGAVRPELLAVVERYGERALSFIWKNKGPLAIGTTLATFVADPEPFINGAASLGGDVVEHVVAPLAEVPGIVAGQVSWTVLFVALATIAGIAKWGRPRHGRRLLLGGVRLWRGMRAWMRRAGVGKTKKAAK